MEIKFNKDLYFLLPLFLFFTILTYLVSDHIFFWDTVQLSSRQAHHFYETNFSRLILPDEIDSGHIPGFGVYLAFIWKIFGKTLFVSHFAVLPFILGIVWQAYRLIKQFISKQFVVFALLLFFADATLLSQFTLVSPDVPLVFFFLMALNSLLINKKKLLSISIVGLFLISMRGMMVAASILMIDLVLNLNKQQVKKSITYIISRVIIYFPAFILFISYAFYHFKLKSWIAYHEDSPWQKNFNLTNVEGFFKNIGILIWRLLDFGRVFLWIPVFILILRYKSQLKSDQRFTKLSLIFIIVLLGLSVSFLLYRSLTAHRYILPVYLMFSLIASYLIFERIRKKKLKYLLFSIVLAGMLSGNLWIYPEKIAQGWDSTLAHLHYYKLRNTMINYMAEHQIEIKETASAFPNTTELKYLDLSNDTSSFSQIDLDQNKYVFYSNIYNDLSDSELEKLKNEFESIKTVKSFGVFIRLYKNKKIRTNLSGFDQSVLLF